MLRVLTLALCAVANIIGADTFRYGAFRLDMDLTLLVERFPHSDDEFRLSDGRGVSLSQSRDRLRDQVTRGTGRYSIRMRPEEVLQGVYFLDADIERGVVKKIHLSLEQPDSPGVTFENRHPACAPLLSELTHQYGRPTGPENSSEEQLENRKYTWKNSGESLELVCGHYFGRRRVFAMDVIFTR